MEGKATPSGPPRTFSVMLGRVEITEQRRIMEGKATPSGPPRTCSVMLGPSLRLIGQGTTAAEPLWGQGLAGGHLSEVPDPVTVLYVWCLATFVL